MDTERLLTLDIPLAANNLMQVQPIFFQDAFMEASCRNARYGETEVSGIYKIRSNKFYQVFSTGIQGQNYKFNFSPWKYGFRQNSFDPRMDACFYRR